MQHADGREPAHPHQKIAVAGDHGDLAVGLGHREAEADHGGAAERPPQIEIPGIVAGGEDVVGGCPGTGHHEQLAPVLQETRDDLASVE